MIILMLQFRNRKIYSLEVEMSLDTYWIHTAIDIGEPTKVVEMQKKFNPGDSVNAERKIKTNILYGLEKRRKMINIMMFCQKVHHIL